MHVSPRISKILVSSSEIILDNLKGKKSELTQLKLNSIVDAKVAKLLPDGKAKLTIKGQTVVAKTHALLTEGETIKLKVVSDGDTKVLKLVPEKNEQPVPQGFKTTRAFGRSGLYSKLTKVLDEYLPASSKQAPGGASIKQVSDEAPVKNVREINVKQELPDVKNQKTVNVVKQNLPDIISQKTSPENRVTGKVTATVEIKPADVEQLKQLVANKNITWPEKVASIILNSEVKSDHSPPKLIAELVEKLVTIPGKDPVPETVKPVLIQLEEMNVKMAEVLPTKEKTLLNAVAKNQQLPWEYKLLTVLSAEKNTIPATELAPVQKFLSKNLAQSEYKIPAAFLPENFVDINFETSEIKSIHTAKKLKSLLNTISIMQGKEPDDEVLKTMVQSSGLVWEKKLSTVISTMKETITPKEVEALINGDIKALAMKLAEVIGSEDKNSGNILRSFVDGLEKMQLLNSHSSDESGRYLLPLPFFLNDTLKFGQLLIDLDRDFKKESKAGEKVIRVAFILEMSRLGHLKADFSMYKKSISGEFGVENEEIQELFHQLIPDLTQSLEEKTYDVKRIGCSVISSGELAGTSLTDMVTDNPDGVLNIVV